MRQIIISLIVAILPLPGAAAEVCQPTFEPWADAQGLLRITLPDGREIQVIGHNHGKSQDKADLVTAISDQGAATGAYLSKIRGILKLIAEAARQSDRELTFLRDRFARNDGAVLAIEADSYAAQLRTDLTAWLDQTLAAQLAKRGVDEPALRRAVTITFGGPEGFLAQNEPGLIKRHPIVGPDLGIVEDMPEIWALKSKLLAEIQRQAPSKVLKDLTDTDLEMVSDYYLLEGHTDDDLVRHALTKVPSAQSRLVERWMRTLLREKRILSERDRHIVGDLMSRKTPVVQLIGYAHLRSLSDKLTSACRAQMALAPSGPTPPVAAAVSR